jgi:hypothetical protein
MGFFSIFNRFPYVLFLALFVFILNQPGRVFFDIFTGFFGVSLEASFIGRGRPRDAGEGGASGRF